MTRFEYWNYLLFYAPVYPYWLWLSLRARSLLYFTATNPGIKNSGVVESSKFDVLKLIPPQWVPNTILLPAGTNIGSATAAIHQAGILFPFIAKPDIGERGTGVEKISNDAELANYLAKANLPTIIQELVPYDLELGVFYHRYPNESKGEITSVVIKDFLSVVGDGKQTLQQLIHGHIRAQKRLEYLENKFRSQLDKVLPKGEKLLLEPIGNHSRGTTFLNGNHLINDQLVQVFDQICLPIPGVYYGRFDLRVPNEADLYAGKNIKILELNGVSAEPAHIYDPDFSIFAAYKELFMHYKIVFRIAVANHKAGVPYLKIPAFWKDLMIHYGR